MNLSGKQEQPVAERCVAEGSLLIVNLPAPAFCYRFLNPAA